MSSVGQTLREAREAKGLTLKDIQESTKIQPHYLKAIEEDRFDRLPGHFYTRAFIRTYAEHVGIDPKPLLAEITKPEEDELESVQEFQTLSRRADREREPSFSLAKWFSRGLLILFLVLVGTVIYTAVDGANMGVDFFSGENSEGEKQTNSESSGEGVDDAGDDTQEEQETEENVEPAVTVEKTSEEGENIYYTVNGTDELTMDVKTSDRVWVEVREGDSKGEVLTSEVLTEGDSQQFTSKNGLYIRVGNPPGLELSVNDTDIATDFKEPRNFIFELNPSE